MIKITFAESMALAKICTMESVGKIMESLTINMTIAESKILDHALSLVDGENGMKIMEHYLFNGTQIQSNYCALYFARIGEFSLVTEAYKKGCIDGTQYKALGCYG